MKRFLDIISWPIGIAISAAVAWGGIQLSEKGGIWFLVGLAVAIVSLYMAGNAVWYLAKVLYNRLMGPQIDGGDFFNAMVEMADESGRTHRGMVATYVSEVEGGILPDPPNSLPDGPTGRGLFKARFFGALFMVVAYMYVSKDEYETEEFLNLASGVAVQPLVDDDEVVDLDRKEAERIVLSSWKPIMSDIKDAMNKAPVVPEDEIPEIHTLSKHLHDALEDSIGSENYTREVKDWIDHRVYGNCAMALNHAAKWAMT